MVTASAAMAATTAVTSTAAAGSRTGVDCRQCNKSANNNKKQ
jgi:hypothetical protein